MSRYTTSFKHTGAAYDEALTVLEEFNKRGSWSAVAKVAYEENVLQKKSTTWIDTLLRYAKKRYFEDHEGLPDGYLLSRFINALNSHQARVQSLYQYICEAHPLVNRLVFGLLAPNLRNSGSFRLTKNVFWDFFSKEADNHPELKEWADYTKKKWRGDFYAFLRSSGLMEKSPSVLVRRFVVRLETFGFFLYGLFDKNVSPSEIFGSELWTRFFLSEAGIEEMLSRCQVRGWLQYRRAGSIFELNPSFPSLEEWIGDLE